MGSADGGGAVGAAATAGRFGEVGGGARRGGRMLGSRGSKGAGAKGTGRAKRFGARGRGAKGGRGGGCEGSGASPREKAGPAHGVHSDTCWRGERRSPDRPVSAAGASPRGGGRPRRPRRRCRRLRRRRTRRRLRGLGHGSMLAGRQALAVVERSLSINRTANIPMASRNPYKFICWKRGASRNCLAAAAAEGSLLRPARLSLLRPARLSRLATAWRPASMDSCGGLVEVPDRPVRGARPAGEQDALSLARRPGRAPNRVPGRPRPTEATARGPPARGGACRRGRPDGAARRGSPPRVGHGQPPPGGGSAGCPPRRRSQQPAKAAA